MRALVFEFPNLGVALIAPWDDFVKDPELIKLYVFGGIPSADLIIKYDETAFYKRLIQEQIATAFNKLNTFHEQTAFIKLVPELKVSGKRVYFEDNNLKLNDLWVSLN